MSSKRYNNTSGGMVIDGIAASEAIDSSGEVLDVKGCDITDLESGKAVLNYEHRGDDAIGASPMDVVGRICFAKKLFDAKDCTNERERMYWKMCKGVPLIYMIARLYDAAGHDGAKAMAAQIRDHIKNDEQVLIRYSIEGSTLDKKGNILKESVARRVAATIKPCNRTCDSGVLEDPQSPWQDDKKDTGDGLIESILTRSERANPLLRPLGGALIVACNPILDVKKSREETLVKLLVLERLQKTLSAGIGGCAPGALTQGAALQREDPALRRWKDVAVSTLKEHRSKGTFHKGEFRSVLKARLPDADDSFIDHFTDMADEFHVKKAEALATLEKARQKPRICTCKHQFSGHNYQPDGRGRGPQKCSVLGCGCENYKDARKERSDRREAEAHDRLNAARRQHGLPEKDKDGNPLAKMARAPRGKPPQTNAAPQLDMFAPAGNTASAATASPQALDTAGVKVTREPATLRGKPVSPNPGISSPQFDEHTGVLHTPRGSFAMYIPGRDNPSEGDTFNNILNDPKVTAFHDYAMGNWAKANGALRAGQTPEELVMHGTLFSQLSPNCLDAETEALTQRGWVKGFDLTMDDVLLTKNPKTGRAEWQKPTDLRFFPDYEGPLVEFKSRSFHAVTTPDHRWLVTTGRGHVREKTSVTIGLSNDKIHRTAEYFYGGESGLTPDEAEVLGWFVTDGHYSRSDACNGGYAGTSRGKYDPPGIYARINQSTTGNPEKCARIEALLQRVAPDEVSAHTGSDGKRVWTLGPKLTKLMLERSPERFLTVSSLLDLDRPALERLYEVMVLGDGSAWLGKEEWQEKETLVTGRKEQADTFQILLTLLGYASSSKWRDMSMYEPKSDKMQNVPKMTGCYVVTKLQRKYARIEAGQKREYQGKVGVWCPVVPNTFFFMRRDGHTCTTGNTPVPVQELMYGHLVDMMRETGADPRQPGFGQHKDNYMGRDRPDQLPQHSRSYFEGLGDAVRIGKESATGSLFGGDSYDGGPSNTGRSPGDVLNIVYLTKDTATKGGFFPSGVNGSLVMSSAYA